MSQDSQFQQAVLAELAWKPSVTAAHVGVTANAGVVTVTGRVESVLEKHAAEIVPLPRRASMIIRSGLSRSAAFTAAASVVSTPQTL